MGGVESETEAGEVLFSLKEGLFVFFYEFARESGYRPERTKKDRQAAGPSKGFHRTDRAFRGDAPARSR